MVFLAGYCSIIGNPNPCDGPQRVGIEHLDRIYLPTDCCNSRIAIGIARIVDDIIKQVVLIFDAAIIKDVFWLAFIATNVRHVIYAKRKRGIVSDALVTQILTGFTDRQFGRVLFTLLSVTLSTLLGFTGTQ